MQVQNNYKVEWTRRGAKRRVHRGGGRVQRRSRHGLPHRQRREALLHPLLTTTALPHYEFTQSDEIELAYCILHPQEPGQRIPGRDPAAVRAGRPVLLTRNLLYHRAHARQGAGSSAWAGAKRFAAMVQNNRDMRRYTALGRPPAGMAGAAAVSGRAVRALLDALYPDIACPLCGRGGRCAPSGRRLCGPARARCASAPPPVHTEPLDGLAAAYFYEGPAREAVLRLKYGGATYLADFFAAGWTCRRTGRSTASCRCRCTGRGCCGAATIRARCSPAPWRSGIPACPCAPMCCARARRTRSQTSLSAAQRKKNLRGAFAASPLVEGLSVLLVDDVATTRATLGACARGRSSGRGAKRVYACLRLRGDRMTRPPQPGCCARHLYLR